MLNEMTISFVLLAADSDFWSTAQNIGSLGFTAWYATYVTTRSIPRMQAAAIEERTILQNAYMAERQQLMAKIDSILDRCDRQVQQLVTEMQAQREHCDKMIEAFRAR